MSARVVLTNVRLDDGNGLALDRCSLVIDDDRIAPRGVPRGGTRDLVVDLQGRTVAVVTDRGAGRGTHPGRSGRGGNGRSARPTAAGTGAPVMPRIWSWPPARLWPPAERAGGRLAG